jgi:cytochrome b561
MAEPSSRFHPVAQLFHWLVAGLILVQIPLAYYMIAQPISPDKPASYALHKSIGVSIFSLSACRLAWRWLRPPPPMPTAMNRLELFLARVTHVLLYLITFAMPISGWLGSSAANFPVSVFGRVTLPDLVEPDPMLHERLELLHRSLAYTLFALLALHVAAAAHHHLVRRDNVLASMLPLFKLR